MAKAVFLLMPEWQGSSSSRAMQLADGAAALREDLPASATREVEVPLEAGDSMGTPVARLSSVLQARDSARSAIAEAEGPVITLGGDCASSLAGLEAAAAAGRTAVLWFDAHPDLQDPSTSPSGSASGMVLRHALGGGCPDLAARTPIAPELLTLVGTRARDPEEDEEIARLGIETIHAADGMNAEPFTESVRSRVVSLVDEHGADRLYVHIDLDVLDPAEFSSVHAPEPFGLTVAQLTGAIRAAVAELPLAAAAICEFAPSNADAAANDRPTVLRLLAALTSGGARAEGSEGAE